MINGNYGYEENDDDDDDDDGGGGGGAGAGAGDGDGSGGGDGDGDGSGGGDGDGDGSSGGDGYEEERRIMMTMLMIINCHRLIKTFFKLIKYAIIYWKSSRERKFLNGKSSIKNLE
ncbi:hypothetical protein PoB_005040000 [Plakobranchus ocellatus]|uniref:Uncharacterized protein n=1 Tax=Plakobranchus ocellatus TaxID=259542 RepID=A0AAV4BXK9_9GAST|nr:hypothetical protein PoB_005040000 [Plakobranchus ocellatus]